MNRRIVWLSAALCVALARAVSADDAVAPVASAATTTTRASGPLDLETTSIRGNQELPKVLYILPWKDPGTADPAGRPLNSLVDEALAPVDREVFRRQLRYFDQLYGGAESKPD